MPVYVMSGFYGLTWRYQGVAFAGHRQFDDMPGRIRDGSRPGWTLPAPRSAYTSESMARYARTSWARDWPTWSLARMARIDGTRPPATSTPSPRARGPGRTRARMTPPPQPRPHRSRLPLLTTGWSCPPRSPRTARSVKRELRGQQALAIRYTRASDTYAT